MLIYNFDTFVDWFADQRGGTNIIDMLDRDQFYNLHDICNAFHMEVELEQARMAREAATRKNTDDAAAEAASRNRGGKHLEWLNRMIEITKRD